MTDLIALHVTQLTKLLSEPARRLIKPIEIDYNFIKVEDQYLFDIAGKRSIKESRLLKRLRQAFIRYEYSESKKPNPAPFIEGTHFHFAIFSDSNQLISKLNEGPKEFVRNFQIIAMTKICITFYQVTPDITSYNALPLFITPYHTLSPRFKTKPFSLGNFKISSQASLSLSHLITPCHSLSQLIP